jgi:hypothetical protein
MKRELLVPFALLLLFATGAFAQGAISQSYGVGLIPLTIGVNVRPARLSTRTAALAIGAHATRLGVTGVPAVSGISVDDSRWGFGVGMRGDLALAKKWLASLDLQFNSTNLDFTDIATGNVRDLQCAGIFFTLGVGRRF